MNLFRLLAMLSVMKFLATLAEEAGPAGLRRRTAEEEVNMHKALFGKLDSLAEHGECEFCSLLLFSQCASDDVVCPLVFAPVCGCDGKTYENKCFAENIYCVPCYTPGRCGTTCFTPRRTLTNSSLYMRMQTLQTAVRTRLSTSLCVRPSPSHPHTLCDTAF
jgi:hypothetical protein